MIHKGIVVSDRVLVLNCVIDAASMLIGFAHYLRSLVPNLLVEVAAIEEMFFGFLLLAVEDAKGWSNVASFSKVVPG